MSDTRLVTVREATATERILITPQRDVDCIAVRREDVPELIEQLKGVVDE